MSYSVFLAYTLIGATVWNTMLISLGYFLGEHWDKAGDIIKSTPFKMLFAAVLLIIIVKFIFKKYSVSKQKA